MLLQPQKWVSMARMFPMHILSAEAQNFENKSRFPIVEMEVMPGVGDGEEGAYPNLASTGNRNSHVQTLYSDDSENYDDEDIDEFESPGPADSEDSDPEMSTSSGEYDDRWSKVLEQCEEGFVEVLNGKVLESQARCDNLEYLIQLRQKLNLPDLSNEPINMSRDQQLQSVSKSVLPVELVEKDTQTDTFLEVEPTSNLNFKEDERESQLSTKIERARQEIESLRLARDSILNQKQDLAQKLKHAQEVDSAEKRKIFVFEETIGAIDSCIEFKNEVICGAEFAFSQTLLPELETSLVTRLTSLSTVDMQRLIGILLMKVVELRYSTSKTDKDIAEMETKYDRSKGKILHLKKKAKELEAEVVEHAERLDEVVHYLSKDPGAAMRDILDNLKVVKDLRKRNCDLELSLAQVLIREGHLTETPDANAKHVAKSLGIDLLQLKLNQIEEDDEEITAVIPASLRYQLANNNLPTGQGMSRRMREAYGHRRQKSTGTNKGHDATQSHSHGQTSSSSHHRRHHNAHTVEQATSSKYKHK